MDRLDIPLCDIFISWTGTDVELKKALAARLRGEGFLPLLSDEHCQSDFEQWSRSAAVSAHVFMPIITKNALNSRGMAWELEAIDGLLCSDGGAQWAACILPLCEMSEGEDAFAIWSQYRSRFSEAGRAMLENLSVIAIETGEDGLLSGRCLDEVARKAGDMISGRFFQTYRHNVLTDDIRLIPLYTDVRDLADRRLDFNRLYIPRTVTEIGEDGNDLLTADGLDDLMECGGVSFIHGAAGCGKSQYVNYLRRNAPEDKLVIALSCADIAEQQAPLSDLLFNEFGLRCGQRQFYTANNFKRLLQSKQLVVILDGTDEITDVAATRRLVSKVEDYFRAEEAGTSLIFTGRNPMDVNVIRPLSDHVRSFRLDKLSERDVEQLAHRLFGLFGAEEKWEPFYGRVLTLDGDIRTNPLLLSQLAIVYNATGKLPETSVGILDAVFDITLHQDSELHANLRAIPAAYEDMVRGDVGGILKQFAREKYVGISRGKDRRASDIFGHILRKQYGESRDACEKRTAFLMEYLRNRAIFADDKFYHRTFLEYFAAVSFFEDSFDDYYGEIEDTAPIRELFDHYRDPIWADVIKLFLVKADGAMDGDTTRELYRLITQQPLVDYTLLLDACRGKLINGDAARTVIAADLLARSAGGEYPPYGPLFWYVPTYELYAETLAAASEMAENARAVALTRDVCVIMGGKFRASDVDAGVDGASVYRAAAPALSGVRDALCELFYTGACAKDVGSDVYPRCFNPMEARSFMLLGHGFFGRVWAPFRDELGMFSHESLNELDGEYVGLISCLYDPDQMEIALAQKPCDKVSGLVLDWDADEYVRFIPFNRSSVRVLYVPENTSELSYNFDEYMPLTLLPRLTDDQLFYIPPDATRVVFPEGVTEIEWGLFARKFHALADVSLPSTLKKIGTRAFMRCAIEQIDVPDSVTDMDGAFFSCPNLTRVRLPKALDRVGNETFAYCKSLAHVDLPETVTELGELAFLGCSSLASIHVPQGVTEIGERAFEGCLSLFEIDLPEGVKALKAQTFLGCESLSRVGLPDGLESVGDCAFTECQRLTRVDIPDSVGDRMGDGVFRDCTRLTSVGLPYGLASVKQKTFWGCEALATVSLPETVTEIDALAFAECPSLTDIHLPQGVKTIGIKAFLRCSELVGIQFPDGLEQIHPLAFQRCSRLESVSLPQSLSSLGIAAFGGCQGLRSVILPTSLAVIERQCFSQCAALSDVVFPQTLTAIELDAFLGCTSLTSVVLPQSLTRIDEGAFCECDALTSVTLPIRARVHANAFDSQAQIILLQADGSVGEKQDCGHLNTPEGGKQIAPHEYAYGNFESVALNDGLESVGENAFEACGRLVRLEMPDSLTAIGARAFLDCSVLSDVRWSACLKTVGADAFHRCGITSVCLPSSATQICADAFAECPSLIEFLWPTADKAPGLGIGAFEYCPALSKVVLPDNLLDIQTEVFQGCSALSDIHLPAQLRSIGVSTFDGCEALTEIRLPESLDSLDARAFARCTSLSAIQFPPYMTQIGFAAFCYCENLEQVVLPGGIEFMEGQTFMGCSSLRRAVLPDGLMNVGANDFSDCHRLSEITLPNSIYKIEENAFENCVSLTEITLPDELEEIGDFAFAGCSSLREITIPPSVHTLGYNLFEGCTALQKITVSANFKNDIQSILGPVNPSIVVYSD